MLDALALRAQRGIALGDRRGVRHRAIDDALDDPLDRLFDHAIDRPGENLLDHARWRRNQLVDARLQRGNRRDRVLEIGDRRDLALERRDPGDMLRVVHPALDDLEHRLRQQALRPAPDPPRAHPAEERAEHDPPEHPTD
jgi:hypothetical protein